MNTKCQIKVNRQVGPAVVALLKVLGYQGHDWSDNHEYIVIEENGTFSWNHENTAKRGTFDPGPIITLDEFLNSVKPFVKVELNEAHTAVVSATGIVVGCTTFPLDIVEKLAQAKKELGL